jgi:hypothetical protein
MPSRQARLLPVTPRKLAQGVKYSDSGKYPYRPADRFGVQTKLAARSGNTIIIIVFFFLFCENLVLLTVHLC